MLKIPTQAYAMWACSICLLVDDQEGLSGRKLELEAKKRSLISNIPLVGTTCCLVLFTVSAEGSNIFRLLSFCLGDAMHK